MHKRFHLTENGPKVCVASARDCPVGGAHFIDKAEAERAFEFASEKKLGVFGALKKKADPYSKHVTEADKRIRALANDMAMRDERQKDGTLLSQFLSEGVTEADLEARFQEEGNTRQANVSYMDPAEGDARVIGLTYGGDFKAEEEYGMAAIAKSLRSGEYGPDDVLFYTRGDATVLAIRGENEFGWTSTPSENDTVVRAEEEALRRYRDYYPWNNNKLRWSLEDKKLPELKADFKKAYPDRPYPKYKTEIIMDLIRSTSNEDLRTPAMGEFQNGRALVIVTKDPLEAKMMAKLKKSHNAGALRVGSSSNPFSRGSLFYDDRDLSSGVKKNQIRNEEAVKSAKAYIAETRSNLESQGRVYAVSPDVPDGAKDIRESRFWLNLAPSGRKQVFGWFTKDQLDRMATGDYSDVPEKD